MGGKIRCTKSESKNKRRCLVRCWRQRFSINSTQIQKKQAPKSDSEKTAFGDCEDRLHSNFQKNHTPNHTRANDAIELTPLNRQKIMQSTRKARENLLAKGAKTPIPSISAIVVVAAKSPNSTGYILGRGNKRGWGTHSIQTVK
jgi:hypothetical protein